MNPARNESVEFDSDALLAVTEHNNRLGCRGHAILFRYATEQTKERNASAPAVICCSVTDGDEECRPNPLQLFGTEEVLTRARAPLWNAACNIYFFRPTKKVTFCYAAKHVYERVCVCAIHCTPGKGGEGVKTKINKKHAVQSGYSVPGFPDRRHWRPCL